MSHIPFVAVHVGAGKHSKSLESEYNALMKKACEAAMSCLRNGGTAIDAVEQATRMLESSPITNAALGSNLTWDGSVECDASVMCGKTGSFGACSGLKNAMHPISVARSIMEKENERVGSFGRIKPMVITGDENIRTYLEGMSIEDGVLETSGKRERWKQYVDLVQNGTRPSKKQKTETDENEFQDTVGAVACDQQGNMAAAVSSGGIWLKHAGRMGEAAHFGSGIWASSHNTSKHPIAVSTTGTGEQIMRCLLSSRLAQLLSPTTVDSADIPRILKAFYTEEIDTSPAMNGYPEKSIGFILYRADRSTFSSNGGEFWYAHSTESMGVGWMSFHDKEPSCKISRKAAGRKLLVSCEAVI